MGLVASVGKNNDELVDNLVKHDSIKNERVERIMRLVDRGKFMPENAVEENAYKDSAWKSDLGLPGGMDGMNGHSYKEECGQIEEESDRGSRMLNHRNIKPYKNRRNTGVISGLRTSRLAKRTVFSQYWIWTGYLSTMNGFFLEENGINHGAELYMANLNNDNKKGAGAAGDDGKQLAT
uniref:Uncharacterized protein n=1 Tax=Meloidogyne javanica TaxID=6303 RepID=A0A915N6L5_MELJA